MKKDFELSRRDPIAHNALITQRREEEARKLRQHVASFPHQSTTYSHPPHSTQPSRWDTHLIATRDMLLPPSTAPAGGPSFYAKRSLPADGEHASKRAKRAPAVTPNIASSEAMEKMFEDLQNREAARPLKGGS